LPLPRLFTFAGGVDGPWRVERIDPVAGESLADVPRLSIVEGHVDAAASGAIWLLHGVTSHERYVTKHEHQLLAAAQPPLGRPEATRAALIPIRKSPQWWELAQDERRAILEEDSKHIETGMKYLPAIARRLHHCRDLGQPFDFLTWFEYAPGDAASFEELVRILRRSSEWSYVEREVDIRLVHAASTL
jgi:chlorite dismutase